MKLEIKNATIKSVSLSTQDYGVLTAWLHLDYGGSGQGFGGYALYSPNRQTSSAGCFIWRVLETVGVNTWEELPGKTIRVQATMEKVIGIGHITEDKWFFPDVEFKGHNDEIEKLQNEIKALKLRMDSLYSVNPILLDVIERGQKAADELKEILSLKQMRETNGK